MFRRKVIKMNKKILVIAVVLMAAVMLATPVFGTAQACLFSHRITREPYHAEYVVHGIKPPTTNEVKGDYRIIKGSVQQGPYDGPLGTGTMTAETIIFVTNTVTGMGWATLENTLVIDSGPYGKGTLVGFTWFKYDNSPLPYDGGTFLRGLGDLRGVSVSAEKLVGPGGVVTEDGWLTRS